MKLNDETYDTIVELSEEGDSLFEAKDFVSTISEGDAVNLETRRRIDRP